MIFNRLFSHLILQKTQLIVNLKTICMKLINYILVHK